MFWSASDRPAAVMSWFDEDIVLGYLNGIEDMFDAK
jgi:hypothetical protein